MENPSDIYMKLVFFCTYISAAQTGILDVAAVPRDNTSLLVQWSTVVPSGLSGCVVEWRPLLKPDTSHIRFETLEQNQSSLVITGTPWSGSQFAVLRRSQTITLWRDFFSGDETASTCCSHLTSSLSSTGSLEPYKPYSISVYPRFKDGIGPPLTVNAYLRQKGKSLWTRRGLHKEQTEEQESWRFTF